MQPIIQSTSLDNRFPQIILGNCPEGKEDCDISQSQSKHSVNTYSYTPFNELHSYPIKATLIPLFKHYKLLRIQRNHGTQFTSTLWTNTLQHHITHVQSSVRRSRSSMVKRTNWEITRCLCTYCHAQQQNCVHYVLLLNQTFNELNNDTTGFTPN